MTIQPRTFSSFSEALRLCLEEEIQGDSYFGDLALAHSGRNREALLLLSRIERVTLAALLPLADVHAIGPIDREEHLVIGGTEAAMLMSASWPEFLTEIKAGLPAFIAECHAIEAMAPPQDRETMQILVLHEIAMDDFWAAEVAEDPQSHAPLLAFLNRFDPDGRTL